jgi:hypothetical protein
MEDSNVQLVSIKFNVRITGYTFGEYKFEKMKEKLWNRRKLV